MTDRLSGDWLRVRHGLSPAAARLASGVCQIAYLGVSVTAQKEGYRPLLHDWCVRTFGVPHRSVNAGVGGLGSISSVFLMDDLVLPRDPALCFIECTTGDMDHKTAPHDIGPAVEGMLRKLADHGCQACLLHLFRCDQEFSWSNPVIGEYERVADRYGTPSINVGQYLQHEIARGTVTVGELFRDVVHTTAAGSQETAKIIGEGLHTIFDHSLAAANGPPSCLFPDHYHLSRIALADQLLGDPTACPRGLFRMTYRYLDVDSATTMSFRLASRVKGLFVVVGPTSGVIRISTPWVAVEYQVWDRWCSYERISTVIFDEPMPEDTPVVITPLPTGERVTHLKIIGLLLHDRPGLHPPTLERSEWLTVAPR